MRVGESECYIKIFLSIQLWIHVKLFASFPSGERSVCDCLIFNCVHTKIKTEFTRASKRDFIKYEKKKFAQKKAGYFVILIQYSNFGLGILNQFNVEKICLFLCSRVFFCSFFCRKTAKSLLYCVIICFDNLWHLSLL